jgi:hypothetical protein
MIGVGYSVYAAAIWPSVNYVVEKHVLGTAYVERKGGKKNQENPLHEILHGGKSPRKKHSTNYLSCFFLLYGVIFFFNCLFIYFIAFSF